MALLDQGFDSPQLHFFIIPSPIDCSSKCSSIGFYLQDYNFVLETKRRKMVKKTLALLVISGIIFISSCPAYSQNNNSINTTEQQINEVMQSLSVDDIIKSGHEKIKNYPKDPHAYLDLGMVYGMMKNDWNKAIEYINQAIKLDPKNADARYALGVSYLSLGRYEKAFEEATWLRDSGYMQHAGTLMMAISMQAKKSGTLTSNSQLNELIEQIDKMMKDS